MKQLAPETQKNTSTRREGYEPIENYGVIGNLHTAALVSIKGSIDFLSFMRFDSPTLFAGLLDADEGGHFSVVPDLKNARTKQLYLPDTNVLVTRFFADEGIAELIDYMPVYKNEHNCAIVRKITTVRGKIRFHVRCAPRFDYARARHDVKKLEDHLLFTPHSGGQMPVRLISDQKLHIDEADGVAEFALDETQEASFILEAAHNDYHRKGEFKEYINASYRSTIKYWQSWIGKATYNGPWAEVVHRSALTLKLLTSHRHGSTVAAATFGLPESMEGSRNWDYRYTWIRDAAFTVAEFLELGFLDEAEKFILWIAKQCKSKRLQLMYAVDGETKLTEKSLAHLEGYKRAHPVKIGNDAYQQFQLDIYGELLQTVYTFVKYGGALTYEFWQEIEQHVDFVIGNWQKPDHGIWEVRGEKREFLHSRVMCWVALDRAIKIGEKKSFPYDFTKWREVRDAIYRDVHENFWDEKKQAFVQSKTSRILDASALVMPIVGFISPQSEKWKKTMEAIDRELRSDVLVYRYREKEADIDGIDGTEGTFSICSFWHVECLARAGEIERAREHFEKMLGYANHLGLFSEQIGMRGQHLGNFPQALTHLGIISAVMEMNRDIHVERKYPEESAI